LAAVPDVEWLRAVIGDDLAAQVTYQDDHHDLDNAITRQGRVSSIRCVFCRYAPTPAATTAPSIPCQAQRKSPQ
jgi:hypothetical protein